MAGIIGGEFCAVTAKFAGGFQGLEIGKGGFSKPWKNKRRLFQGLEKAGAAGGAAPRQKL